MAYHQVIKRGVFAALTAQANTTITTGETYYPINGTFSNTPIDGFQAVADPAIQYTDAEKEYFEIDWQAACSADDNGRTVHFAVKKNGTLVTESINGTYLKTANEAQTAAGTVVVELAQNDKIQLVVTSSADGDVITVLHFTTTIRPFYR